MTSLKDVKNKRKIIMEHYINPNLYGEFTEKADINAYSTQCIDEMHIKLNFVNNKLNNAIWYGKGCAIFKSSVDIFLEHILNKSKKEIFKIANEYEKLINQKPANIKILGKLIIYENVKKQLNRLMCANIISQAIIKKIK